MGGLLTVAALLLVTAEIDVNATVVGEVRVGEGPLAGSTEPVKGVILALTPIGDLALRAPNLDLIVDYGPRIFWREPNRTSRVRPLIFHVANLSLRSRPTETVTVTGVFTGAVGEPDYSLLGTGATSGTALPTVPTVVTILTGSARLGALWTATRMWDLGLTGEATHRRPLGDLPPPPMPMPGEPPVFIVPLPRQTIYRLEPLATGHLSQRTDLLFFGTASYQIYSTGAEYLMTTLEAGFRRRLTPTHDLRLLAGVAYLESLGALRPGAEAPRPLSPIGTAELNARLLRGQGLALNGFLGARVEYFVDPVFTYAVPRGTLTARFMALSDRDWMAGLEASFSTNLSAQPILIYNPADMRDPPLPYDIYETMASLSVPIRHRLSDHMVVEFGVRWTERGKHLRADDFQLQQRQLWFYGMLTWTTRDLAQWMTADSNPTDNRVRARLPVNPVLPARTGVAVPDDLRVRRLDEGAPPGRGQSASPPGTTAPTNPANPTSPTNRAIPTRVPRTPDPAAVPPDSLTPPQEPMPGIPSPP